MNGPIPTTFAAQTCKIGKMAACCRYLGADPDGLCCLKETELKALLDERVFNRTMNARGDNCEGWSKQTKEQVHVN